MSLITSETKESISFISSNKLILHKITNCNPDKGASGLSGDTKSSF